MKNVVFGNRFNCAVVIANPIAITNVENICDIMSFAGFLSVMINDCKQLVLLLLLLVFIL